jgi:hypothetical protein
MPYTLIGLGVLAYVGAGILLLVRSGQSDRRRPFHYGSGWEPLVIVLWPVLPRLWWTGRR